MQPVSQLLNHVLALYAVPQPHLPVKFYFLQQLSVAFNFYVYTEHFPKSGKEVIGSRFSMDGMI